MLSPETIHTLARRLIAAERARQPIALLSSQYALSMEDAYRIQEKRIQLKEEPTIGYKLGFTSKAMRKQMGIHTPNFGLLTRSMLLEQPVVPRDTLIHPRIEPEIALQLRTDLAPEPTLTEVFQAIDLVAPCLEIVDTRYTTYQFTAQDNTADNSSAAYFVLGWPQRLSTFDLRLVGMVLHKNSQLIDHGVGAETMGNPLKAVQWLAHTLHEQGKSLKAGDIILTGGLTPAYLLDADDTFTAVFDRLGTVSVTCS